MKKSRLIKAIGRKRRTLGWALLTLGVLVAGVWVASRWWTVGYGFTMSESFVTEGMGAFGVFDGVVRLDHDRGWRISEVEHGGVPGKWSWVADDVHALGVTDHASLWFASRDTCGAYARFYYIVLWPIPLLLWTPAALLLRSGIVARRRAQRGQCVTCGYDLAGLATDTPCPECGKAEAE